MSTLADSMLSWKANLTTRATPEQVLTLRADVNAFADGVRLLESENTKLRERVAKLEELLPENGRWFRAETVEAYVAEIAKLRKLVSNCHGWLAINYAKGYVIPRNGLDAIEQSMHELGVEVDE